jgi:hypothetical protein
MKEIFKILPILLYMIVGAISAVMAVKNLSANKFLPFQQKAADRRWDEIDHSVRIVILMLLRLAGIGFLIIAILLLAFPIINYFTSNIFYKFSIPLVALIYCTSLFVINYSLFKKTKANTPWKGSIYAMIAIIVGIIISFFN